MDYTEEMENFLKINISRLKSFLGNGFLFDKIKDNSYRYSSKAIKCAIITFAKVPEDIIFVTIIYRTEDGDEFVSYISEHIPVKIEAIGGKYKITPV